MSNLTRILVVDENPHFRTALVAFLQLHQALQVVGAAGDAKSALAQAEQHKPHVILLDLNLGEHLGLERIPIFRQRLPEVKIIILCMMNEKYYRSLIQSWDADGFVSRAEFRQSLYSVIMNLGAASSRDRRQANA